MRNSSQNSLITRSLRLHSSRWFVQGLGAGTDQEHLFTETLIQEDMLARDFTLLGDSNDYSANLRTNTNLQWNCHKRILQTRMHPPNQRLVDAELQIAEKMIIGLRSLRRAILKFGDNIACWVCCHDLGGNFSLLIGNFSLLIEKVTTAFPLINFIPFINLLHSNFIVVIVLFFLSYIPIHYIIVTS